MGETPGNDNYIALEPSDSAVAQQTDSAQEPDEDVGMTNGARDSNADELASGKKEKKSKKSKEAADTASESIPDIPKTSGAQGETEEAAEEEPSAKNAQLADMIEEPAAKEPMDKKKKKKSKSKSKSEDVDEGGVQARESSPAKETPAAETVANEIQDKKIKKTKKSKKSKSEVIDENDAVEADNAQTEKAHKKRRREAEDEDATQAEVSTNAGTDVVGEAIETAEDVDKVKDKKRKKSKKSKKSADDEKEDHPKEEPVTIEEEKPKAEGAEQWNVQALGGGAARQDKFMRLLGAKRAGNSGAALSTSHGSTRQQIDSIQNDLERQFEAGMKKKDLGGKRGLGA
jgi:hypothetical protein